MIDSKLLSTAISSANTVDRSNEGHHKAMMELICGCLNPTGVANREIGFSVLSEYMVNRFENSSESLCTLSTVDWLKMAGIHTDKDGGVSQGKNFVWNKKMKDKMNNMPWYKLTVIKFFKKPGEVSFAGSAAIQARREYMGDTPLTQDEVWALWTGAMKAAPDSKGHQDWVKKAVVLEKKGKLSRTEMVPDFNPNAAAKDEEIERLKAQIAALSPTPSLQAVAA